MRTKQLCMHAFLCTCCAKPEFNTEFFNKSSHAVVQNTRVPKSQVTKALYIVGKTMAQMNSLTKLPLTPVPQHFSP